MYPRLTVGIKLFQRNFGLSNHLIICIVRHSLQPSPCPIATQMT
jgi:hypothetical protein